MKSMSTNTVLQVREFPADLRLKLRAVSMIEKKPMHQIVRELVATEVAKYSPQIDEMFSVQES